jgi:hypothetical protein
MTRALPTFLAALTWVFVASSAHAELVFFTTGRVMSVKGHRAEGDSLVLLPREGGEIVCAGSLIARIEPDEVPYPEPVQVPPQAATRANGDGGDEAGGDAGGDAGRGVRLASNPGDRGYYDPIIDRVSAEQGVDAKLVRAVIQVESGYQERARSPKGAMGLMQLMPTTARQYAVVDPYDPTSNIEAGIKHLRSRVDRFPVRLALAAYKAGESAVERFRGVPPYPETLDYIARVLQLTGR